MIRLASLVVLLAASSVFGDLAVAPRYVKPSFVVFLLLLMLMR